MKINFKKIQIEIEPLLRIRRASLRSIIIGVSVFIIVLQFPLVLFFQLFRSSVNQLPFSQPLEKIAETLNPNEALATYQFVPTAGAIVTGTAPAITSAAVAAAEGVNVG
ncbi:hypothetical protein EPN15_00770, partial [Patescibacteria group bacterium]